MKIIGMPGWNVGCTVDYCMRETSIAQGNYERVKKITILIGWPTERTVSYFSSLKSKIIKVCEKNCRNLLWKPSISMG